MKSASGNVANRAAEQMEESSSSQTIDHICQAGDIVFEVGENENQRRMLVSSIVLRLAAPAFAALLGPHFREGRDLSNSQLPLTVPLPDDKPEAMADLLHLLHYRPVSTLASDRAAERILSFAVAADKWCCIDAVGTQAQGMLLAARTRLDPEIGDSLVWLVGAAYQDSILTGLVKSLLISYN